MTPIADTVTEVRESVPEYEAGSYQKSLRQQGDAPQETSLQQGGAALPERPSRGAAVWRGSKFPIWLEIMSPMACAELPYRSRWLRSCDHMMSAVHCCPEHAELASTCLVRMTPIADTVTEVRESVPESLRQQGGAALPERPSRGAAVWRCSKFPIWLEIMSPMACAELPYRSRWLRSCDHMMSAVHCCPEHAGR
ncbi:hypothetical protein KP509_28G010800 [Ceratopteris richardii]|uniref:Uncharacterized protein n=2 Tax=Ceratopteris richardii TaxID=49495 RepID=A0A8T2RC20_CERRI|nr:hypothetical protein KP509_28G010700 [Ceratopteris richardii]KAH7293075.1 hypothetical protein KP509_28G010800 [Ceratopteris richardii]